MARWKGTRTRRRRHDISADGVLGFGEHDGKHIAEVDESYVRWLLGQHWISDRLREAVEQRLDIDRPDPGAEIEPSGALAGTVMPLIVWRWQQVMRREYATND